MGQRRAHGESRSQHDLDMKFLIISLICFTVSAQDDFEFAGSNFVFKCPEPNGLFADPEQCDLYYVCEDNVAAPELCEDGLLFDDSRRNKETCKLPHGVDCGLREFVQEPQAGIDPRCPRANGIFDHEDEDECHKFYLCDKGTAHEMPCVSSLVFDVAIGSCVRPTETSEEAKKCGGGINGEPAGLKTIEGFTCPGKETIGPQGQVFDALSLTCKDPLDVPECSCWYDCGENSNCPGTCQADCSCPVE